MTWSVGLLVSALWLPVYSNQTVVDANGITLTTATYLQRNGAWVLIPIALPALASLAVALAIAHRGHSAAHWAWLPVAAVWVAGLITVVNAGGLLLPAAIGLSLALRIELPRAERKARRPRGPRRREQDAEAS